MSKPSFKSLYDNFASECKARKPAVLQSHISPSVQIHYKGEQKDQGLPAFTKIFTDEWSTSGDTVEVIEIKELSSNDAVTIKAVDRATDTFVTSTFHFGNEGGEWRVVKLDTDHNYWQK